MFCSQCGNKNNGSAMFCASCGEALTPTITQTQNVVVNPPGTSAFGVFWGLVLFFIVLPIGACFTCVSIGAAGSSTHTTSGGITSRANTTVSASKNFGDTCTQSSDCSGSLICHTDHKCADRYTQ